MDLQSNAAKSEVKFANETKVGEFLPLCKEALSLNDAQQLERPLKVLAENWVETCADLRLLVQENELRQLGLPLRLCLWVEEQLKRLEASEVGGCKSFNAFCNERKKKELICFNVLQFCVCLRLISTRMESSITSARTARPRCGAMPRILL